MAKNEIQRPEFEYNGVVYRFEDLTVRQMELLSDMLHESRKKIWDDFQRKTDGSPKAIINFTVSVADLLHELRRQKKVARFVAVCMTRKSQPWQEEELAERAKEFSGLPYSAAEQVFRFFFNGGIFSKILMPGFLMKEEKAPLPDSTI